MRRIQGKNIGKKGSVVTEGDRTADSLISYLDKALVDEELQRNFKHINGFHPSYGYECKRRWVLLFRGAECETKIDARTKRIFDNGHDVHARWRGYFRDTLGILIDAEVEISIDDPVPIRGHADGIINWGGRKLYELKSISPWRFDWRKAYNKPDAKTYQQAQLYLYCLDLEEGYVIYENKGTQAVLIFPIKRDEEFIDKILRKYTRINKIFVDDKIPPRPYKRDSEHCKVCDLEKYCWDVLDD